MHRRPQLILLATLLATVLVVCLWTAFRRFDIAVMAYAWLAAISLALAVGSWVYQELRKDDRIAAMLFGAGFLCAFSAAFSLLNYLLLTIAGTRIDALLAQMDMSLGLDWPATMAFAADHPGMNLVLQVAYSAVFPQMAILLVCLGCFGDWRKIYPFCLSVVLAAAVTVGFWTIFPSFGSLTVYDLPQAVTARLQISVDAAYARDLLQLFAHGPERIAPDQVKGLIAFPSFHAVLAVLVAWYARSLRFVHGPILVLTAIMLVSIPIHGGHHFIDVPAGIAVALVSAMLADRILPMRSGALATKIGGRAVAPASSPEREPALDGRLAQAGSVEG